MTCVRELDRRYYRLVDPAIQAIEDSQPPTRKFVLEWPWRRGLLQSSGSGTGHSVHLSFPVPFHEHRSMKTPPTHPNTSDADAAVRIALVREMTEAARNGVIGWGVRDRRLRALFHIDENSRAFDSSRPC